MRPDAFDPRQQAAQAMAEPAISQSGNDLARVGGGALGGVISFLASGYNPAAAVAGAQAGANIGGALGQGQAPGAGEVDTLLSMRQRAAQAMAEPVATPANLGG